MVCPKPRKQVFSRDAARIIVFVLFNLRTTGSVADLLPR